MIVVHVGTMKIYVAKMEMFMKNEILWGENMVKYTQKVV
jgi:hypothetical protein